MIIFGKHCKGKTQLLSLSQFRLNFTSTPSDLKLYIWLIVWDCQPHLLLTYGHNFDTSYTYSVSSGDFSKGEKLRFTRYFIYILMYFNIKLKV